MGDYTAETFLNNTDPPINDTRLNALSRAVANAHDEINKSGRKISVRAATQGNITLSGTQTVDVVSLNDGDRVLVKSQTNAAENGIYVVSSAGAWSRASDFNTPEKINGFSFIFVWDGFYNWHTEWYLTNRTKVTLGTTNLNFSQRIFQSIFSIPYFAGGGPPALANPTVASSNQQPAHNNLAVPGDANGSLFELGLYDGNTTNNAHLTGTTGTPMRRIYVDTAEYSYMRIVTNIIVPGSANATIRMQWLNTSGVWQDMSSIAGTPASIATAGQKDTDWIHITSGRVNDAVIRLVVSGNTITAIDKAQTQLGLTYIMFK